MHSSRAASDDAGGLLIAETAPSAAACTTRDAYAEMASAEAEGARLHPPGAASRPPKSIGKTRRDPSADIPPATEVLPEDGQSFVEAVHEHVDIIALEVWLLHSEDEKIVQRELAYLRELKYGKSAAIAVDDEIPRIVFGSPDPPGPGASD